MCEDVREAILRKIYDNYGNLMKKIAYNILHDYQEAEDIVQIVLHQLISKHIDMLKNEKLKHYLCVAAKNTAINLYRSKSKEIAQDPFVLYEMTADKVDVQAFQDQYGFGEELGQLLEELDHVDKDIICLHYGWKYSYAEIANAVGLTDSAVRKRAERALKKLNVYLLDKEVGK